MNKLINVAFLGSMLFAGGCATSYMGTTVVSPRFQEGKTVSLMYETVNLDASQLWFANHLNQALMKNGYTVVERLHYPRVLQGLTGNIHAGLADTNYFSEFDVYGFTPTEIKETGKAHGVDYIGVFSQSPNKQASFRVIDCKTAEIVATSVFVMPAASSVNYPSDVADIFVLSLKYAFGQKDGSGRPAPVYIDFSQQMKSEGKLSKIDKILYQKNISVNSIAPRYATIFTVRSE